MGGFIIALVLGRIAVYGQDRSSSVERGLRFERIYSTPSRAEATVNEIQYRSPPSSRKISRRSWRYVTIAKEDIITKEYRISRRWWHTSVLYRLSDEWTWRGWQWKNPLQRFKIYCKKMREAQTSNMLWQNLKELLKRDDTLAIIEDRLFCKRAPTDRAIQIVVPRKYRSMVLYHGHCLIFAGHPGSRKTYDVHRKAHYWSHMASDVHDYVFKFESCTRHKLSQKAPTMVAIVFIK